MNSSSETGFLRDPGPNLEYGELVPASHILDDWLVWMGTAAGTSENAISRDCPFRRPNAWSPWTEKYYDDDESVTSGCRLLCQIADPLRETIGKWAPELTSVNGRIFSGRLFEYITVSQKPHRPWTSAECQSATSSPTAHEAASCWISRFKNIAREIIPSLGHNDQVRLPPRDVEMCIEFLKRITWYGNVAIEMSAGLEQERRWLHQFKHRQRECEREFSEDYYSTWFPPLLTTNEILANLSAQQASILEVLSKQGRLKKDKLKSIAWPTEEVGSSGAFNRSLNALKAAELIASGGRGTNSKGYSLTIQGELVVSLKYSHRAALGNQRSQRLLLPSDCPACDVDASSGQPDN